MENVIVFGSGDSAYTVSCGDITKTHYALLRQLQKSSKPLFEATVASLNDYLIAHYRKLLAYSLFSFYKKINNNNSEGFCLLEPHIRVAQALESMPEQVFLPRFVRPPLKPIVKKATPSNVFSLEPKFIELEKWYTNLAKVISEIEKI